MYPQTLYLISQPNSICSGTLYYCPLFGTHTRTCWYWRYSFALSLVTYFASFTNLGVNLYGQRQIAYLKNENKEVYSKAFWELVLLRVCLGVISSAAYFILIVRISDSYLLSALLTLEILNMIWIFSGYFKALKTLELLL